MFSLITKILKAYLISKYLPDTILFLPANQKWDRESCFTNMLSLKYSGREKQFVNSSFQNKSFFFKKISERCNDHGLFDRMCFGDISTYLRRGFFSEKLIVHKMLLLGYIPLGNSVNVTFHLWNLRYNFLTMEAIQIYKILCLILHLKLWHGKYNYCITQMNFST